MKKFYAVIGNPPYQDQTLGDNKGYAPPIYNRFLDGAYGIADRVEMVHPARFLFNAGSTPKNWNEKMLQDKHLKVIKYEPDSSKVFPGTDIKGGIAVTYHDVNADYGAIGIFTKYEEFNSILYKVISHAGFESLSSIVFSAYSYKLTDKLHHDFPEAIEKLSKGHMFDMKSNVMSNLTDVFLESPARNISDYVKVLGRIGNDRVYRFIKRDYVVGPDNFTKYKLFLSKATGTGLFGEMLSSPVFAGPEVASTEAFLSIGSFECENALKSVATYLKTKFLRSLLGVLKVTQDITPGKFQYVPLQDFTKESDINWAQPTHLIDRQLYAKYGLSPEEIEFIETHVKEMS